MTGLQLLVTSRTVGHEMNLVATHGRLYRSRVQASIDDIAGTGGHWCGHFADLHRDGRGCFAGRSGVGDGHGDGRPHDGATGRDRGFGEMCVVSGGRSGGRSGSRGEEKQRQRHRHHKCGVEPAVASHPHFYLRNAVAPVMCRRMGRRGCPGNGTAVMAPRTMAVGVRPGRLGRSAVRPVTRHQYRTETHLSDRRTDHILQWDQAEASPIEWCVGPPVHPGGAR